MARAGPIFPEIANLPVSPRLFWFGGGGGGSGVDDSAEDLKEKVPTNNEVCFHGETLPTTNYTELVGTMLGWGNDVAGGKGPSMAQAADRVQ